MPRLRQVSRDQAPEGIIQTMYQMLFEDRDPVEEPGTATGAPGDWWTVFALVPDVFEHCVRGFGALREALLWPLREVGAHILLGALGSESLGSGLPRIPQ